MRCTCEQISHGEHGIVQDDETMGRLIFSPQHICSAGKIKPGLFNLTDIKTRGLSLVRLEKIESENLRTFAEAVANLRPSISLHGYAKFSARMPRKIKDDDQNRVICLFDDPTEVNGTVPANPAHALLVSAYEGMNDVEAIAARAELLAEISVSEA